MVKLIKIFGLVIQTEKGRGNTIDSICDERVDYEVREKLRQSGSYIQALDLLARVVELREAVDWALENIKDCDIDIVIKAKISQPLFRQVLEPLKKLEDDVQKTGGFKKRVKKRRKSAVH